MFSRLRQRTPETQLVECPDCGKTQELAKGVISAFCKHCHARLSVEQADAARWSSGVPTFAAGEAPTCQVRCPHCGKEMVAPKTAINAKCAHCQELFPLRQGRPVSTPKSGGRVDGPRALVFHCYSCGAELTAAEEALSTMCPKCGQRVELRDLEITARRQQDLATCGRLHVAPRGVVEGQVNAGEVLIEGEVRGQVISGSALVVGATGRCYGEVVARALRVDKGAVFVGPVRLNEELLDKA
jgi:predicted RNA-binding Zn-ribbon protein involved in translation (DUF1610 family)